jgi:PAS domain S-box-containing protein
VHLYFQKQNKKAGQTAANEQTIFGENTASGIIIISATSTDVGNILHCNSEIQFLLGYKPSDLIGRNVDLIMPGPISTIHCALIRGYFASAKSRILNVNRQVFAVNKDKYLRVM